MDSFQNSVWKRLECLWWSQVWSRREDYRIQLWKVPAKTCSTTHGHREWRLQKHDQNVELYL